MVSNLWMKGILMEVWGSTIERRYFKTLTAWPDLSLAATPLPSTYVRLTLIWKNEPTRDQRLITNQSSCPETRSASLHLHGCGCMTVPYPFWESDHFFPFIIF
jgi:hypothetical protein